MFRLFYGSCIFTADNLEAVEMKMNVPIKSCLIICVVLIMELEGRLSDMGGILDDLQRN